MPQTYDYSNTQNEGPEYASQWHQWVEAQPWFRTAISQLHQSMQGPQSRGNGTPGSDSAHQALREFQASVGEMSKKSGHLPPQDFYVTPSGDLGRNNFLERNPWVMYALMAAGPVASLAIPAAGAGAAAGSAGSAGGVSAGTGVTAGGIASGVGAATKFFPDDGSDASGGANLGGSNLNQPPGANTNYDRLIAALLGNGDTHGMSTSDMLLLSALQGGLGIAGGALTQPQQRHSFTGTDSDPRKLLGGATQGMQSMFAPLQDRMNRSPSLPGVQAPSGANMQGGGLLPFDIGVQGGVAPTGGGQNPYAGMFSNFDLKGDFSAQAPLNSQRQSSASPLTPPATPPPSGKTPTQMRMPNPNAGLNPELSSKDSLSEAQQMLDMYNNAKRRPA